MHIILHISDHEKSVNFKGSYHNRKAGRLTNNTINLNLCILKSHVHIPFRDLLI